MTRRYTDCDCNACESCALRALDEYRRLRDTATRVVVVTEEPLADEWPPTEDDMEWQAWRDRSDPPDRGLRWRLPRDFAMSDVETN